MLRCCAPGGSNRLMCRKAVVEPASAFVHEFIGESVRFDCMVSDGLARTQGLPNVEIPTTCPAGPAVALIRPHEIGLLSDQARRASIASTLSDQCVGQSSH